MQVATGTLELWVTTNPTGRCCRGQVQAARLQAGLEPCLLALLPMKPFPPWVCSSWRCPHMLGREKGC